MSPPFFIINGRGRNKAKAGQLNGSGFINEIINKTPESFYANIINPLLTQIENYRQWNFEITGIIGIKGSPVCGIYNTTVKEYGSFIILLNKELQNRGIHVRMTSI